MVNGDNLIFSNVFSKLEPHSGIRTGARRHKRGLRKSNDPAKCFLLALKTLETDTASYCNMLLLAEE